jgi:hypothetical protein
MHKLFNMRGAAVIAILLAVGTTTGVAYANHSWGGYHWARTANPFLVKLGNNVSGPWVSSLNTASTDWSLSPILDTQVVAGSVSPRTCRPTNGRVEVCNNKYGNNGWLGVASIWANGSHITQGTVKLNDTYFNTAQYNTPAWRSLVACQEIGHTFGLDHQDENFTNAPLGTCMDYTNDPTPNQHPNQHDYDELAIIYTHFDSSTSAINKLGTKPAAFADDTDTSNQAEWGKEVRHSRDGKSSLFERDHGNGNKVFTFVVWAK